jgi:ATP/maltotriose-dependent transcriptional regulator MalT
MLRMMAAHLSNREMWVPLSLAVKMVKWYARNVHGTLAVNLRVEAVIKRRELGLTPRQNWTGL